jgi:hypothetical protein
MDAAWDEQGSNDTLLDNAEYSTPMNSGPGAYQEFSYLVTASGTETNGAILPG